MAMALIQINVAYRAAISMYLLIVGTQFVSTIHTNRGNRAAAHSKLMIEPEIVSKSPGESMPVESCRHCIESVTSVHEALAILNSPPRRCETCSQAKTMRNVVEQFRTRQPHWWVVDGAVVVPIWIVELLKKHRGETA